jgi:hypothetical protein
MKKLISLVLLTFPVLFVSAQREYYVPTTSDLEQFFKTTTYAVMDANPMSDFNFQMQEAMKADWKITKSEFLDNGAFEEKSKDQNSSFVYTSVLNFEKDKTDSKYIFLHLSLGGDNLTLDDLRDLASIPLGYQGEDPENYMYKIGLFLKFIQDHVNLIYKNPSLLKNNIFNYYNTNAPAAHDKVLYLLKTDLTPDVSTEAKIKEVYKYKFKIVTPDEIRQAVEDGDQNIVFLHKVGPKAHKKDARCYKIIIGAGDGKVYYYDYHKVSDKNPDGLLKSDLVSLNK